MTKPKRAALDISIILLTFKRPVGLRKALKSLAGQQAGGASIEIIVADNDPAGSARKFTDYFANQCRLPVHYVHVPDPGVANARNAALAAARGHYLAFLDDDQIAGENWLETLIAQAEHFSACMVFCPTYPQSGLNTRHKAELLKFFERDIHHSGSKVVDTFFGCGNSLLDLRKCTLPSPAFCPTTNDTGGEDDKLFSELRRQGGRIVWTGQTHVLEDVDDKRMTRQYVQKRSFAYGQGPSRICANPDNRDVLGLVKWTAIGMAQFAVYAPLYVVTTAFRSPKSIWYMRKTAEAAGKVLWFEGFRPKLYGSAWLKAHKPSATSNTQEDDDGENIVPASNITNLEAARAARNDTHAA